MTSKQLKWKRLQVQPYLDQLLCFLSTCKSESLPPQVNIFLFSLDRKLKQSKMGYVNKNTSLEANQVAVLYINFLGIIGCNTKTETPLGQPTLSLTSHVIPNPLLLHTQKTHYMSHTFYGELLVAQHCALFWQQKIVGAQLVPSTSTSVSLYFQCNVFIQLQSQS